MHPKNSPTVPPNIHRTVQMHHKPMQTSSKEKIIQVDSFVRRAPKVFSTPPPVPEAAEALVMALLENEPKEPPTGFDGKVHGWPNIQMPKAQCKATEYSMYCEESRAIVVSMAGGRFVPQSSSVLSHQ
mmetsp:Transcript_97106/g.253216  ORF Transcript_97106/g.253216 Transcript_97106/m.253216 type:complete len:128 (-) Transcript_97106:1038-1421(-)